MISDYRKDDDKREIIRSKLLSSGATAVGFAKAAKVSDEALRAFRGWLSTGNHAGMEYMERNQPLREDPSQLLEGTRTVVSLAFNYNPEILRGDDKPQIARYAYGEDYHKVIKRRLKAICREIERTYGCKSRICVDSAPIFERYWALRSGIGRRGDNGCIIIDKTGSYVFLCEILLTMDLPSDEPSGNECIHCGICRRACPTGALKADGTIDCRKCLSYLTIEDKGRADSVGRCALSTESGRKTLFGCDICQRICPYNREAETTTIPEFQATERILKLSCPELESMTEEEFNALFRHSPLSRAGLEKLQSQSRRINSNNQQ